MKKTFTMPILFLMFFAFGCSSTDKFEAVSESKPPVNATAPTSENSAVPAAPTISPTASPAPANKLSPVGNQKVQKRESQPEHTDSETAYSPVYGIDSKQCKKDKDENLSEGDEFQKVCKGFGGYELVLSGFDYRVKYEISNPDFSVMLFPLEDGEAGKYVRADQYDQKLGERIEWRLDDAGKPYAAIVRVMFYKNVGSEKTFSNPKNKVAEFVFVRGLKGYEDLKADLRTTDTAYNPDEQARMVAYKYFEKHRK